MDTSNYKPNSFKSKEEAEQKREKPQPVVSGTAKRINKSEVRKLADVFLPGDVDNVKTYIVSDVLVPSIKNAVSDIVKTGIDILLYGEDRGGSRNKRASKTSYTSYSSYYNDGNRGDYHDRYATRKNESGYSYADILIPTRAEAEEVLSGMGDILDTYGTVSVADLFDLCGITPEFTDNKYGWKNIATARVARVRDGYVIKMPKAIPLD